MTTQSDATDRAPGDLGDSYEARAAGHTFAPAFLLTAACCRWPPSQARDAAVRAAAAGITDWSDFLLQANRQRVVGLVHDALSSAGTALPPAVAQELALQAQRIVRQNLTFVAETVRLQRALEGAGIPILVLKGVALAQLAYGSLKTKHARDIDLLVPPDHAEAALQFLERDGYALSSPAKNLSEKQRRSLVRYGREAELVQGGRKLRLELHWRAAENPLLLKGVDAYSAAQSVALGNNISVRTLAPDDLFAYLCVHGARHAWSRLKWLADVNALIAADGADIEHLYRHAQRIGAGLCAGQALLLCRQLLALPLPVGLAAEISTSSRMRKLTAVAVAAMTAPHTDTETDGGVAGVARFVFIQFLLGQGWAFYATQCRVTSVGAADVVRLPLPRFLHFLYPLLRLPLWFWRRASSTLNRHTGLQATRRDRAD